MEIYFGPQFDHFIAPPASLSEALLMRAVMKRILTPAGAAYLRSIK